MMYRIDPLIRQLNTALVQYETEKTRKLDITPTQSIFLYILFQKDREGIYARDICAASGLSKATISSMVKSLKNKGYLTMEYVPQDERKKAILLTKKAYEIQKEIEEDIKEREELLCRGISRQELLCLAELLQKMKDNVTEPLNHKEREVK